MPRQDILQEQWLILALGAGLALWLAVWLAWRMANVPRPPGDLPVRDGVPPLILALMGATFLYGVIQTVWVALHPTGW